MVINCGICGEECDGKFTVINPGMKKQLKVCTICLNAFGHRDYDVLTKRLENNPNHPMNREVKNGKNEKRPKRL